MDEIEAHVGRETTEGDATSELLDVAGIVRSSVGDLFRMPRLDRRGVVALVGLVAIAWLSTSLYRVQPDEKGVVLRFGRWVATTEPGLHVHLPYPIEICAPAQSDADQSDPAWRSVAGRADGQ